MSSNLKRYELGPVNISVLMKTTLRWHVRIEKMTHAEWLQGKALSALQQLLPLLFFALLFVLIVIINTMWSEQASSRG